jgi:hypothetical protein
VANVTITTAHFEIFPAGTIVKAYAAAGQHPDASASGTVLSEAEVLAEGTFSMSLPANTRVVLEGVVEGKRRRLMVGNPEGPDQRTLAPRGRTLQQRIHRRRVLVGA